MRKWDPLRGKSYVLTMDLQIKRWKSALRQRAASNTLETAGGNGKVEDGPCGYGGHRS